jgi:hypothetical protein
MKEERFLGPYSQCAQECAHAVAALRRHRIAELVVGSRLIEKATVFSGVCFQESPPPGKIARFSKCFRGVYLQVCGEVAERLKAVVC